MWKRTLLLSICCLVGVSGQAADPDPAPAETSSVVVFDGVRSPGIVKWSPDLTVISAILRCGGMGWTAPKQSFISRGGEFIGIPLDAMIRGKAPDVKLQPGDKLVFVTTLERPQRPQFNPSAHPLPELEFVGDVKFTLSPNLQPIWRRK